ncbi:hypothetical protein KSC_032010 [Ktedonobacter sp. SOSP1-52]|nr:hypothetical protein KSC_030410 [Ktedonobacter sp. SOSP1-52]GHO64309.1 hypothetical protein KSC_032010 [Ktedonobacter sp. SOSP1-52]
MTNSDVHFMGISMLAGLIVLTDVLIQHLLKNQGEIVLDTLLHLGRQTYPEMRGKNGCNHVAPRNPQPHVTDR